MQFLVISHQLWEILLSLLIGMLLGAVYDFVRFIRRIIAPLGHRLLFANIFDTVYILFFGCVYCMFVYVASSGHFRWFTAIAMLSGAFIWRALPSKLILPALYLIADKLLLLLGLLIFPVRKLFSCAFNTVSAIKRSIMHKRLVVRTEKYKKRLSREVSLS